MCEDTFNIMGKNINEARKILASSNKILRAVKNNGNYLIVTRDFLPHRLNVEIENDKIKEVLNWG